MSLLSSEWLREEWRQLLMMMFLLIFLVLSSRGCSTVIQLIRISLCWGVKDWILALELAYTQRDSLRSFFLFIICRVLFQWVGTSCITKSCGAFILTCIFLISSWAMVEWLKCVAIDLHFDVRSVTDFWDVKPFLMIRYSWRLAQLMLFTPKRSRAFFILVPAHLMTQCTSSRDRFHFSNNRLNTSLRYSPVWHSVSGSVQRETVAFEVLVYSMTNQC